MTKTRTERGAVEAVLVIIAAVIGIAVLVGGVYLIRWVSAPARGALDSREQTVGNGSYRIATYDHFFNLCSSIQSTEDSIDNTQARPVDAEAGFSAGQKGAILLALENTRATMVRQYNADAAKADTQAHFLSSRLPYSIDATKGAHTSCN